MARLKAAADTLQAAQSWKEQCVAADGSVLSERALWTASNLDQLDRYFVQNLLYEEGDFFSKLEGQLAPTTPEAKQLAAEMFWALYLFVDESGMKAGTKRLQIKRVWEWSGEPLPDADFELGKALEGGVGRPGTAFNTHRWRETVFFIDSMRLWKGLPADSQRDLLANPWHFGEWLDDVPSSKNRQFRHMLLYLLFPDSYERMSTGHQKRKVVAKMGAGTYDEATVKNMTRVEVDRALLDIRQTHEAKHPDQEFDFYRDDVQALWRVKEKEPTPYDISSQKETQAWFGERFGDDRVWAFAPGVGGHAWDEFQESSIAGIGWDYLDDLTEFDTKEAIAEVIREQEQSPGYPRNSALACWQFAHELSPGDYILAKQGRRKLLGYGRIRSDYRHEPDREQYCHVRDVEWLRAGDWTLPVDRQITTKTLTDFTPHQEWLKWAFELMDGEGEDLTTLEVLANKPYAISDALAELFMSRPFLASLIDALERKRNIILEGPPGVGKTFAARRIAWTLMGTQDSTRIEMVQFHQSYSYEDFIQGWRPAPNGGFELQDGVFYRFCERAKDNPGSPHVLIIDEINRGNLSKVFGELMMLIEPDKRGPDFAIPLTYSPAGERFFVPDNLYLIGSMNTADRSLALVDYALRRRFSFFRLQPAFERESFQEFLLGAGADEAVVGRIVSKLISLNQIIRDDTRNLGPGFEIGHSYFCPTDGDDDLDDAWYERVVRREIEPLLYEYWFDQPDRAKDTVETLLG